MASYRVIMVTAALLSQAHIGSTTACLFSSQPNDVNKVVKHYLSIAAYLAHGAKKRIVQVLRDGRMYALSLGPRCVAATKTPLLQVSLQGQERHSCTYPVSCVLVDYFEVLGLDVASLLDSLKYPLMPLM
eukprot:537820-Amphidinium_carterae.1